MLQRKPLLELTDEEVLHVTCIYVPHGDKTDCYRRTGATRVWKTKEAGRMRFHIPLMYGLYTHTYFDNTHLLFNTGAWAPGTYASLDPDPEAVRGTSGKAWYPKDISELGLRA